MLKKLFYEEKGLFFQSLHPLPALVYLGALLILALAFSHPLYLAGLLLVLGLAIWAAEGLEAWENYLKIGLAMMLVVIVINPLMVRAGQTVLWHGPSLPAFGRLNISLEAIYYGIAMSVRLLNVISVFCLYNLIVHPDKILNLLSRCAGKSALIISIATRMFPAMVTRFENIKDVQQLRGINFRQGPLKEKVRKSSALVNILILSSLEDSLEIAESMQARAFGSGPRSCYRRHPWRPRDTICLLSSSVALGTGLGGLFSGFGAYTYYPQMAPLFGNPGTLVVLAGVLFTLSIPAILSWGWHRCPYLKSKI